jgi:hypothetical protein
MENLCCESPAKKGKYRRRNFGPSTGRFKRRYLRRYKRMLRADPAWRRRQSAIERRAQASNPELRSRARARHRRWISKNREHVSRYNARYHRECRARRCSFCGQRGRPGRGQGIREIERMVPEYGELVMRKVFWCGRCHSDLLSRRELFFCAK